MPSAILSPENLQDVCSRYLKLYSGAIADILDKRASTNIADALKEVRADANLGGQLGVGSTPTLFLNGRKLPAGVVDPAGLDALIELELQRAK